MFVETSKFSVGLDFPDRQRQENHATA